jgi:hypothetical protein
MSRPENENPKERLEKTARELRKHRPRPSEALVSRIERLAERGAARRSRPTRPRLTRRRLVFALAAALTVATVGAIVHGETQSSKPVAVGTGATYKNGYGEVPNGSNTQRKALEKTSSYHLPVQQTASGAHTSTSSASGAPTPATYRQGVVSATKSQPSTSSSFANITSGGRLADLRATLLLKVENRDQLSQQTAEAMKIAYSFSGYVATSYLELKVPAARSQEALIKISSLGKILSQDISLKDLKTIVTSQSTQILGLRHEIASLRKSLTDPSLSTQARSQLQAKLDRAKAKLGPLRVTHQQTIRRGRLATITVTFTTGDLPKIAAKPSRIHKAIDRAWNGLSSEISWTAIGLIVASPFLLLAALLALLVRSRRRREERRLLEQ